jgi:periplasmic protein TonB
MIAAERWGDARSIGWLASLGLHAGLTLGALLVSQALTLVPETTLFRWNVAMVTAPSTPLQSSAVPPPTPPQSPMRPTSQVPVPRLSAATDSVSYSPGPTAPLPHSEEPKSQKTDVSSTVQGPPALERTERQPEELADSPGETAPANTISRSPPFASLSASESMSSATQPSLQPHEAVSPVQTSSIPAVITSAPRHDYAWLSETIMRRMQELKHYPAEARLDRSEGKVILKAVIRSDGGIGHVEVFQSSGHQSLDRAAVESLTLAAPFHFPRPLGMPQMTVKIPMNYRLEP